MNEKLSKQLKNILEHGWTTVDLRNCGLTEFPSEILKNKDIAFIDLGNDNLYRDDTSNKITEIPKDISKLQRLATLKLDNNLIEELPQEIGNLPKLKVLNLEGNKLRQLPVNIAQKDSLSELNIKDNPFEILPPEIAEKGLTAIKKFFRIFDESDFLYEAKLLIVGEGRVGKTSITKSLVDENYRLDDQESTEGINIEKWVIPAKEVEKFNSEINRDLQINIWDFGGQEIYHSTHQFFLTARSLYLLVTESRKEDSHDDFFYWLNIVRLLGSDSPVCMVLNKCDQPTKELPIKEYKQNFPSLKTFDKISLENEPEYRKGFIEFKEKIISIAANLPHIGKALPKVWVQIRMELDKRKSRGENYISLDSYLEICKRYYLEKEDALFLSEFFHDLGVIVHFQDNFHLRNLVILDHEWITRGVYEILDDQKVIDKKGKFSSQDLIRLLDDSEHSEKVQELVSIMTNSKFDLCFKISDETYLIPRLLTVDEPEFDWNSSDVTLRFVYKYEFMPKGILARLIVKLNKDIYKDIYWRYGVLLEHEGHIAIVTEKFFERKISIEITGSGAYQFLFYIRKAIGEINKDFNKLKVEEMIPCNCEACVESNAPHYFKFGVLNKYSSTGRSSIVCEKSMRDVEIHLLTHDMVSKEISERKIVACENKNAELFRLLKIPKLDFLECRNSNSVFSKVKAQEGTLGIRDRDFLLDSEISIIEKKYKNYVILRYYCLENYLYHPDNLAELNIEGFDKESYKQYLITQKNLKRDKIVSIYIPSRQSYEEFKIQAEKLERKNDRDEIVSYLDSDDIEEYLKVFSLKDHLDKSYLSKYQLTEPQLASSRWFAFKMNELFNRFHS